MTQARSESGIVRAYEWLLGYPILVATVLVIGFFAAGYVGINLQFDASSETLVVEDDAEFAQYRALAQRFPSDDYLFITLTPPAPLMREDNLLLIGQLQADLDALAGVDHTTSIANAPIIESTGITSLNESPDRLTSAARYFSTNKLFAGQLISEDGSSAAIQVVFSPTMVTAQRAELIAKIRALRDHYQAHANIEIAGVPLIAHDMMAYLRDDVRNFGIAAIAIIGLALYGFFRRLRWVALCAANAILSIVFVIGLLVLLDTPVSVVSGNFISLLAIISISLTIHLVVRFRELMRTQPEQPHVQRVMQTMRSKFAPCFYTAATTIVAFTSLLTANIPPVEDFGWMMSAGVVCAFVITYTFFPAILLIIGPGIPSKTLHQPMRLTLWMEQLVQKYHGPIALCGGLLLALCIFGMTLLSLNSNFSQYFKPNSDIRQGLEFVDSQFGGVLPMDVVLQYPPYEEAELDEDDDFFMVEEAEYQQSSWFEATKVTQLEQFSAYLRQRDDVGSATSFADIAQLAQVRTSGKELDDLALALLVTTLGDNRGTLLRPYANPESGEMRIAMRMRESTATAQYQLVVGEIEAFAKEELHLMPDQVQTTGIFILFGQSIHQLFDSQRDTLLFVIGATLVMFIFLLRSFAMGGIAISVNVLAAAAVLGFMGFTGIPMDMMTITIAAITIGIGVDDAFHYLHRYIEERRAGQTPSAAVTAVHGSIGRAIYFTSLTVVAGFSLLGLSNFVPTIYFGVLTALAMVVALLANLLLLPCLLLLYEKHIGELVRPQAHPPR